MAKFGVHIFFVHGWSTVDKYLFITIGCHFISRFSNFLHIPVLDRLKNDSRLWNQCNTRLFQCQAIQVLDTTYILSISETNFARPNILEQGKSYLWIYLFRHETSFSVALARVDVPFYAGKQCACKNFLKTPKLFYAMPFWTKYMFINTHSITTRSSPHWYTI